MINLATKITAILFCSLAVIGCDHDDSAGDDFTPSKMEYPETKQVQQVDTFHGQEVADPYRWLEDDHSEETAEWVAAQNGVTKSYLEKIPYLPLIRKRLEEVWNYERFGSPFKRGGKYYYFKNDGLQDQSVLYRQDQLTGPAEIVLDPNDFSEDGTVALGGISFNQDGSLLAYATSEGGSDWRTVQVLDLSSGKLLSDRVEWVKFSGMAWAGDGFYYSRFPEPDEDDELSGQNEYHRLCFHRLGTSQSEDPIIMEDKEVAQSNFYSSTSEDEKYLFVSNSQSTSGNALFIKDLQNPRSSFAEVYTKYDADLDVVEHYDGRIFILTNKDAPRGRLVAVDPSDPGLGKSRDILPEGEHVLQSAQIVGGKIFARYLVDASSRIKVYDLAGTYLQDIDLPGLGSVSGISGTPGDQEAFFSYTSYTQPTSIYSLDAESGDATLFKAPKVEFDSEKYETNQVFFASKDGTRIPMFVTHKKGLELTGDNPTLLYGYGGFDISLTPGFSTSNMILLENGGVYAVANLRGGGEYGKEWHKAGTKERKQNVFDDFQAAAEYLISEKYTRPEKLAIMGGSNGGLLVGASMTQRPDLFQVAIPRVGVLDMLRYHEFTIGWAWAEDYGRSDDPEAFEYLMEYSPLHNVKEIAYPATMVTTADHDDRVVPAHSFKFISELQSKHTGENPVLIRVETSAGHGAGKPISKIIDETADILSFMFYNLKEDVIYRDIDS